MFIYVGGVPGSGKTSLIVACVKLAREKGLLWEHTVGTPIMCELAGVKTVAELRQLPENTRSKLRPLMNERIYGDDRKDPATVRICDGHFCFFDVQGNEHGTRSIQPGDPEQMKGFIIIQASPDTILHRRLSDKSQRSDRQLSTTFIEKELELEEQIASQQAEEQNIPLLHVVNDNKDILASCTNLFDAVAKILG